MVDTVHDPLAAVQDQRAHMRTFHSFSKLVLFAVLHIVLVLACLALAFLGNAALIAVILGVAGTVALIAAFAIY
jgi:Bacterial aa3 type cytochrome c oxidase subunit IV